MDAAALSYSSAVCLIPPRSCWERLQEVRCFKDKAFVRWPPHINLLYPFLGDRGTAFEEAARRARDSVAAIDPLEVTLKTFGRFEHGRSCTLWLDPESAEMLRLQAALQAAFPGCTDLSDDPSRGIAAFRPHLSLGQWRSAADAQDAQQELQAAWRPVTFTIGHIALVSRGSFHDPFRIRWEVPIGSAGSEHISEHGPRSCRQVDVPYVAACGSGLQAADTDLANRYGIGAESTDGVWYFAYGANISPRKLSGSRGIQPLESRAARLPGWRLTFDHRGAMGNVRQLAPGEVAPSHLPDVHGVVHRLRPADMAKLTDMEHEYRPMEVTVDLYPGAASAQARAIAFVSPHWQCIADGLPPSDRYVQLLRDGAHEWQLDPAYVHWLDSLPSVPGRDRGAPYYTSMTGAPLKALPKLRIGHDKLGRGGRGSRGRSSARGRGRQRSADPG